MNAFYGQNATLIICMHVLHTVTTVLKMVRHKLRIIYIYIYIYAVKGILSSLMSVNV